MNASAPRRFRRRLRFAVAAVAGLLSLALGAPAFATIPADGGPGPSVATVPVTTSKVINMGVAIWQVTLIAVGAALLGAAVILLVIRLRSARRLAHAGAA
jgi:hypothetical protein